MRISRLCLSLALVVVGCGDGTDGDSTGADAVADAIDGGEDAGDAEIDGDAAADADGSGDADTDGSGDGDVAPDVVVVPDESVINAFREHDEAPIADAPFLSEETTYYRAGAGAPWGDATVVQNLGGRILVGTTEGLMVYSAEADAFVASDPSVRTGVLDVADATVTYDGAEYAVVATVDDVVLFPFAGDSAPTLSAGEGTVSRVATDGTSVWGVADGDGWLLLRGAAKVGPTVDSRTVGLDVRDVAVLADGSLAYATADGLATLPAFDGDGGTRFAGYDLSTVDACPGLGAVAGSAVGLHVLGSGVEMTVEPGIGSLPTGDITALDCGTDVRLIGHAIGATAFEPGTGHIDHYASQRWLLDNHVNGVAFGEDGSRWFATPGGVTRVSLVERTLAEKTADRHAMLETWFRRLDGFVAAEYVAPDRWGLEGGFRDDKDNDGLWTQMMIGAWTYAHAVTGDDAYCEAARRSIANMLLLVDIPCESFSDAGLDCGFVARSFVRDDEGHVYESKVEQDNWHPVEWIDGHTYRWKDDTSSDELDGHTYGFPLYFDICATEEEREVIAETFAAVTDYIIDGGYVLLDLDGERTLHGHWNPATISSCVDGFAACPEDFETCGSACFGGGYLNGMEILGQLLVTWHMTGDERYYLEYERLIREERYDEVITDVDNVLTLHEPSIENHSDHELMMLAYHSLIRYEPNEDRRQRWAAALLEMYETERVERHPLWVPFVAGLTGEVLDQAEAVESLQLLPWDLRKWPVDASHRQDYTVSIAIDRHGQRQFEEVPPYDELNYAWWNGNPHAVAQGGNPRELQAPTAYLIAYWAMRYYGLVE